VNSVNEELFSDRIGQWANKLVSDYDASTRSKLATALKYDMQLLSLKLMHDNFRKL